LIVLSQNGQYRRIDRTMEYRGGMRTGFFDPRTFRRLWWGDRQSVARESRDERANGTPAYDLTLAIRIFMVLMPR